jgi:hypothetical protein
MEDGIKMEKPELGKKFAWGLFATGTCLFIVAFWFGTSMVCYKASETVFPLRTAGWFVIGSVSMVLISGGFAAVFCFIAKKFYKTAWLFMLIVSGLFIFKSVDSALPKNKLACIIGEDAVDSVTIEEFYTGDSFNDGIFAYGILHGDQKTMTLIKKYRSLQYNPSVPSRIYNLGHYFKGHKLPETGDRYSDARGYFFVSPQNNRIYFFWHSR